MDWLMCEAELLGASSLSVHIGYNLELTIWRAGPFYKTGAPQFFTDLESSSVVHLTISIFVNPSSLHTPA